jgi:hypothetical protein
MLSFLLFLALAYLGLCAALYFAQGSLIYFPQARANVSGTELLSLQRGSDKVLVTTRPRDVSDAVLYFGGNAEDVAQGLPDLDAAFPDSALYLMHYRGYGGSSGSPSESALVGDALALYDHLRARHPRVTVIGRSLGSGVAVQLASQRPVARLVLITPYDSLLSLAVQQFPWVPVRLLMRDRFESVRHAPRIDTPTLVIAAEHDEVIPRASTEALLAAFRPGIAKMDVLPGTSHNSLSLSPDYVRLLRGQP